MSLANDFLRSLAVKPEVLILLGDSDLNVVSIPCQLNFFSSKSKAAENKQIPRNHTVMETSLEWNKRVKKGLYPDANNEAPI